MTAVADSSELIARKRTVRLLLLGALAALTAVIGAAVWHTVSSIINSLSEGVR